MASTLVPNLSTPTPNPSPQGGREWGKPQRRGVCPGLSAPMPTGEGLLVRLLPIGTIPFAAFTGLCSAARAYGNGVIEITSRGSIQVRGLSDSTAPQFGAAVGALNIAAQEGVAVHCNPLAGLDAEEIFDGSALAATLRSVIARRSKTAKLSPKVSVAIDGGGALDLATLAADIRLCAQAANGDIVLRVGVGGDTAQAADLGCVASEHGAEAVTRLLDVLVERGRDARARDIVAAEGTAVFRSAIADFPVCASPRDPPTLRWSFGGFESAEARSAKAEGRDPVLDSRLHGNERKVTSPIGSHRLRDGSLACGVGLAFGHADGKSLEQMADAALAAGATGFRAAPGRSLLTIGLTEGSARLFAAAADKLGFIVRADDPRRHVVACAGSPICASAHIASRTLAPLIADNAAPYLDDGVTIHISGCAKGCAQAAPAALTIVGTPDGAALIAHGRTRDTPFVVVQLNQLPEAIGEHLRQQSHEPAHV